MGDPKQANLLLSLAEKDLRALNGMVEPRFFDEEIFGFHAQQAVEKTLKAWLAILGVEYPLTHSIIDLLYLLQRKGKDVEAFWNLAALQDFAVRFRYELSSQQEELMDRGAWIEDVKAVHDHVKDLLGEETSSEQDLNC